MVEIKERRRGVVEELKTVIVEAVVQVEVGTNVVVVQTHHTDKFLILEHEHGFLILEHGFLVRLFTMRRGEGVIARQEFRCEPFPTYPRTYDMVHAEGLLSLQAAQLHRCSTLDLFAEIDRFLRPELQHLVVSMNLCS